MKYPVLSYVGIQVGFWSAANNLMAIIIHLHSQHVSDVFGLPSPGSIIPVILFSSTVGIIFGAVLGTCDYYLERFFFRRMVLGGIILLKAILSILVSCIVLGIVSMIAPVLDLPYLLPVKSLSAGLASWRYTLGIFIVFYLVMTVLISFINQVNKKYGPGVLLPLLFGKYRDPLEEMRVFMFMDLKSSTAIAESLGHFRYSSFIRDAFDDINLVLPTYQAEIYQYVGDEIVVSWNIHANATNTVPLSNCVLFFFACQDQFLKRGDYYTARYGFFPAFKAGLHMGMVTAVEIGDIKRDIAYHGDTINTAARIQSVCNQYEKEFLVSERLLEKIDLRPGFKIQSLGLIQLKGKSAQIGIASIER